MHKAMIFGTDMVVTADDVKNGICDRNEEFVDPEYEVRVRYVSAAKNNGGPYFRLYYTRDEYLERFPMHINRYDIVSNMTHFEDSEWHISWKERLKSFCEIEKFFKNPKTGKRKYADAYTDKQKICVELQHSYIAGVFDERNAFYDELGIDVVWLFDMSTKTVAKNEDGYFDILEDNSKGLFRIAEQPDNLKKRNVFFHANDSHVYRVRELNRRKSSGSAKSTIRCFRPDAVYSETEFVKAISDGTVIVRGHKLTDIWKKSMKRMIVENIENGKQIMINCDKKGEMFRSYRNNMAIVIKYVTWNKDENRFTENSPKEYLLSRADEKADIWALIKAYF